jgi:hypothetical protein
MLSKDAREGRHGDTNPDENSIVPSELHDGGGPYRPD